MIFLFYIRGCIWSIFFKRGHEDSTITCTFSNGAKTFAKNGGYPLAQYLPYFNPFTVNVRKLEAHRKFSWQTFKNDICVLTLEKDVTNIIGGEFNFPCLPPRGFAWSPGTECYAAGWGLTKEWGSIATELQSVNIDIIADNTCTKLQDHSAPEMICAGVIGGNQIIYILLDGLQQKTSAEFCRRYGPGGLIYTKFILLN